MGQPNANTSYPCAMNSREYSAALFGEVLGGDGNVNSMVDYWWTDWGGCAHGDPALAKGTSLTHMHPGNDSYVYVISRD